MKNEAVVFVHGIWMKGFELLYLSNNLKKQGYHTYHFRYKSLFQTPQQNADLLKRYLDEIDEPVIHLVCHSLGGIVALNMLERYEPFKPGKVILLGTPVNGSAVAKHIHKNAWLSWLLGKSTEKGLLDAAPSLKQNRDVYMIAGESGIGMGMLLAHAAMKKPNDGTVNLEETKAHFIKQHISVPYSHFAMLWSKQVVSRVIEILEASQK